MRARTNGIELEYETFGDPSRPTILLVMGFSLQMVAWEDDFCEALAARGYQVVRFDNRDVGLSTKLDHAPPPSLPAIFAGDTSSVPYTLDAMADDCAGLIDALGIAAAHVVGVSMGGMIAQLLAIRHPARVRSLVSIMSSTGDRSVGRPRPEAMAALMMPPPSDREAYIAQGLEVARVIGSKGALFDEPRIRRRLGRSFDRAFHPRGVARQLAAIMAAPDRTRALGEARAPTAVIHGVEDPLIDKSGGEATARAIAGARLHLVERMAHDLPEPMWTRVIDAIVENATRTD